MPFIEKLPMELLMATNSALKKKESNNLDKKEQVSADLVPLKCKARDAQLVSLAKFTK